MRNVFRHGLLGVVIPVFRAERVLGASIYRGSFPSPLRTEAVGSQSVRYGGTGHFTVELAHRKLTAEWCKTIEMERPMPDPQFSRLIVGISGATGSLYGVRLLQALQGS